MYSNQTNSLFESEHLTAKEAAGFLNVSGATISNWLRLGVLQAESVGRTKLISKRAIESLKDELSKGTGTKLKSRANKIHTTKKRVHSELNTTLTSQLLYQSEEIASRLGITQTLILIAERIVSLKEHSLLNLLPPPWIDAAKAEISAWKQEIGLTNTLDIQINDGCFEAEDTLGKIYQHLSESSNKATGGAFYTPEKLALALVSNNLKRGYVFLDPCCGSGAFLLAALKIKIQNNENDPLATIFGFDIDPIATRIARINLIIGAGEFYKSPPQVKQLDFIEACDQGFFSTPINKVDFIATNPPWGASYKVNNKDIQAYATDSFSTFLGLAIENTRTNGKIAFLLPESFTDIAIHAPIRRKLINSCIDIRVENLGKVFDGLLTNVTQLEAVVARSDIDHSQITLVTEKCITTSLCKDLLARPHLEFIFNVDDQRSALAKKIYRHEHLILGKESEYALGIVTGNNEKFLSNTCEHGQEGILKGKDIFPFIYTNPTQFIKFERKLFQQCVDERLFRAPEKLIYRFISDKLVFAYDNQQRLTLNSANFIIPKIGIPTKVVLAILQSSIAQFIFKTNFNSIKVLKKHIQALPIFKFDPETNAELEKIVDEAIQSQNTGATRNVHTEKINLIIYKKLALSEEEISIIEAD